MASNTWPRNVPLPHWRLESEQGGPAPKLGAGCGGQGGQDVTQAAATRAQVARWRPSKTCGAQLQVAQNVTETAV